MKEIYEFSLKCRLPSKFFFFCGQDPLKETYVCVYIFVQSEMSVPIDTNESSPKT
jgi:hypothetical protein